VGPRFVHPDAKRELEEKLKGVFGKAVEELDCSESTRQARKGLDQLEEISSDVARGGQGLLSALRARVESDSESGS
jgi:hypothetical protein